MKGKFFIPVLMLISFLCFMPSVAEAQKKSKKVTRTERVAPKEIEVQKNWDGFPDPTGHVYTASGNGITMTLTFNDPYSITVVTKDKRNKSVESWGWHQEGGVIYTVGATSLHLSEDGKALLEPESNVIFNIVK